MRTIQLSALMLGAIVALGSGAALAEKADRNKPTVWEADRASYDDLKQITVLQGSAVVNKGTLSIKADKVVITQDPEGFQYGTATGTDKSQAWFRQKRDAVDEFIEGSAQRIDYDSKNDRVVLSGRAVMKRIEGATPADEAVGDTIIYDNRTDTYEVVGKAGPGGASSPSKGRASGVIAPRSTPQPGAAKPAPTNLKSTTGLGDAPKEPGR
ncbi:lipopolysaccharide transport periplasmic protein LptA [soil metagenome]